MSADLTNFSWRRTTAPTARRTDDIFFLDENLGWAVNSNGQILRTQNGGDEWTEQKHLERVYLRCVGFANANVGWVGSIDGETPADRLLHTANGGLNWNRVTNLPDGAPRGICGLSVVDESTVYASGTNYPTDKAAVVKTVDGGRNWTAVDLSDKAALLVDIYFKDRAEGWVVGGENVVKHPARPPERDDVIPTVLHTIDGGGTWTNAIPSRLRREFPRGEWGWKIQALDNSTIFVSLENLRDGAILRSDDSGQNWRRLRINDRQRNSNLEGIGFLDRQRGWVGGWGDLTFKKGTSSATANGGDDWDNANDVGLFLNRFRFIGNPLRVAYASGNTVYKFTDKPAPAALAALAQSEADDLEGDRSVTVRFEVPAGTKRLVIDIWEHYGRHVVRLAEERNPRPGARELRWNLVDASGAAIPPGGYILRITTDGRSESRLVRRIA